MTPTSGKETAMRDEVVAAGVHGCPADDPSARRRRAEAIRRLPGAYSLALRLREAGLADDLIAECLAMQRDRWTRCCRSPRRSWPRYWAVNRDEIYRLT